MKFEIGKLDREVDADGIGWHPKRARAAGLLPPVVVFVRKDGWSLGAGHPAAEEAAEEAWRGHWTHFARASGSWELRPIAQYEGCEIEEERGGYGKAGFKCPKCGKPLLRETDMCEDQCDTRVQPWCSGPGYHDAAGDCCEENKRCEDCEGHGYRAFVTDGVGHPGAELQRCDSCVGDGDDDDAALKFVRDLERGDEYAALQAHILTVKGSPVVEAEEAR